MNCLLLTERLPENPAVVDPFNEVGTYGGDLRFGFVGNNPGWGGMWYTTGWENLVIWKPDFSGVDPNIAESWEVSDDVTGIHLPSAQGHASGRMVWNSPLTT